MSDIKAGDLVVVVKPAPCCGNTTVLGRIFRVSKTGPSPVDWCGWCMREGVEPDCAKWDGGPKSGWIQKSRLKRIPPLPELEGEKNKEELTA